MRVKVCIIGHFGSNKVCLDGQTIKTKIITAELKKQLGDNQVNVLDTHGGKRALIKCFFKSISALKNCDNIIMLPAHNGVRFFTPVLLIWNLVFHRKLHYSVIGGWLPNLIAKKKVLSFMLKKFDYIYVETNVMKHSLEEYGFTNTVVVPNCKELTSLKVNELIYNTTEPYPLCTFSRVNRLKGIEDAIKVLKKINRAFGRPIYKLDIYGQVDEGEEAWFDNLMSSAPDYINYCGQVPYEKSVEVIKKYFALVFPTKYYTEGIPGTIIDAYAAGVPVISARWQSFADIIDERVTGIGYEFNNVDDLERKLLEINRDVDVFNALKINCLEKSKRYIPSEAIKVIIKELS